jgi:tetraacyldisaccharide 4'-kinase
LRALMAAPGHWQRPPDRPGLMARLLTPLGWLYAWGTAQRLRRPGYKAAVPVICVGNLTAGGAGKTPVVIALIEMLSGMGHRPQILSRGHGGRLTGPVTVDPVRHSAADCGDEPLLLAAFAPTVVARDRAAGARLAIAQGADVLVMDDGFQNPDLVKSLSIVVVDAERGFGNGLCLPAGPLREPVATGLSRADLVVVLGGPQAQARFLQVWGGQIPVPVHKAQVAPLATGMRWSGLRVLAFAGIAYPQKFFATLAELGATVVKSVALADHEPLSPAVLARLENDARLAGAQLVTTEKDAVRLPEAFRPKVLTLPVRLVWEDEATLRAVLARLPGIGAQP